MGTCIPIFMDGLSASFKGMEPINSRSPVSRLLVHLSLPHSCFLLSLPDRPETKQSMSLQRGPKELSLQIGMLNLKKEGGGFQNQIQILFVKSMYFIIPLPSPKRFPDSGEGQSCLNLNLSCFDLSRQNVFKSAPIIKWTS